MIDQTTFSWLVGIITLAIIGIISIFMVEAIRMRFKQVAKSKILLEIRTPIATIERYLVGREENILTVRGTDGNPYDYIIDEKSTYNDDYPLGLPVFMQSVIKKAYYDEGVTTPNTRKQDAGDKDKDSRILARAREKAQVDADARQLAESSGLRTNNSNTIMIVLLVLSLLISGANAYFGYTSMINNQLVKDALIGKPK